MSAIGSGKGKVRVLHLITGLDTGGAETMLHLLLEHMDRGIFESHVISMVAPGALAPGIEALGIPVTTLAMTPGVPNPLHLVRLANRIRKLRPAVIQTWMYQANLLGSLASAMAGSPPVVWGIHHCNLDRQWNKAARLRVARMCAWLSSRAPSMVVFCSQAAQKVHEQFGYAAAKATVIPNGFKLDKFYPDRCKREQFRSELGLSNSDVVVGNAGRFDPQKDYQNFVQAAAIVHKQCPQVQFVLCGEGLHAANRDITDGFRAAGMMGRVRLLGRRKDMPAFMNALDVALFSSVGEAFPLAVGEAMACGTPCAVTDVGDSALLVGDTGRIAPPRNPQALGQACLELVELSAESRRQLGAEARRRIADHFSIDSIASRYEQVYLQLADGNLHATVHRSPLRRNLA